jgi:hypothetical protein
MAKKTPNDQFSKKEAAQRFESALKGARLVKPGAAPATAKKKKRS